MVSMSTASKNLPVPLGLEPSFGFGDRLGVATPGHLEALRRCGGPIRGIFAQQSIREMQRTQRTPAQVMCDASGPLANAGFADPWGADADHLKTEQDVDITADAGFVFFTIDPSDHVDTDADGYAGTTLQAKFDAVAEATPWTQQYLDRTIKVPEGPTIVFDAPTVQRAAVKYGLAIAHAVGLAGHIARAAAERRIEHEIELSVDETPQPTTYAEHYIIADQCRQAAMRLVSLAPRYIGDFEKGVDYKGDVAALEASLRGHAAIAAALGPYKLSLHSGSDKLSMYAAFARATQGRFHVKTAGTSYLEALRVVARHDETLFRRIIDFSRQHYDRDKATYHVSAAVSDVPPPSDVADAAVLEQLYLQRWEDLDGHGRNIGVGFTYGGRQILHCTFGSVLTDPELGPAVRDVIVAEAQTHAAVLADHFARHLEALRTGM